MRFWDSSGIVPLLVREPYSGQAESLARADPVLVVWWGTRVECTSALQRRLRDGTLTAASVARARKVLEALTESWTEILPIDPVRSHAEILLASHELRAADALQLAAALQWCQGKPAAAELVCLDQRLRAAAQRSGFSVLPA